MTYRESTVCKTTYNSSMLDRSRCHPVCILNLDSTTAIKNLIKNKIRK